MADIDLNVSDNILAQETIDTIVLRPATIGHKDLTGVDLHEPKGHEGSHGPDGGDRLTEVEIDSDKSYYIGPDGSDGSWRFRVNGDDLVFERRESSVWVEKGKMVANAGGW